MAIDLECWTCRKKRTSSAPDPTLACELSSYAIDAGMKVYWDLDRGRILLFCDDECLKPALRKDGGMRAHRPKNTTHTRGDDA